MTDNEAIALVRQANQDLWARAQQALLLEVRSPTQYIDAIPGRRIFYTLGGSQLFTSALDGLRGSPINMLVSQDGPFVMTHYPMVLWRPSIAAPATNLGHWRPISTYPLPDQVVNTDIIDISYEFLDGGSQRNFQNATVGPLLSQPQNVVPLPMPSLFSPNTVISFVPTYERIDFSGDTDEGFLGVWLPGYRIVNM